MKRMAAIAILFPLVLAACSSDESSPAAVCSEGDCKCLAGQTCNMTCKAGNCNQQCSASSTCTTSCEKGGCSQHCEAQAAKCTLNCEGGGCNQMCFGNPNCTFTCAGGNCTSL